MSSGARPTGPGPAREPTPGPRTPVSPLCPGLDRDHEPPSPPSGRTRRGGPRLTDTCAGLGPALKVRLLPPQHSHWGPRQDLCEEGAAQAGSCAWGAALGDICTGCFQTSFDAPPMPRRSRGNGPVAAKGRRAAERPRLRQERGRRSLRQEPPWPPYHRGRNPKRRARLRAPAGGAVLRQSRLCESAGPSPLASRATPGPRARLRPAGPPISSFVLYVCRGPCGPRPQPSWLSGWLRPPSPSGTHALALTRRFPLPPSSLPGALRVAGARGGGCTGRRRLPVPSFPPFLKGFCRFFFFRVSRFFSVFVWGFSRAFFYIFGGFPRDL